LDVNPLHLAQKIRNRISDLLETASLPGTDLATKKRLLHFCVVGGGPTGIEFAAELHGKLFCISIYTM
jgi:NADH dehydrogenase FAD-containing subunit